MRKWFMIMIAVLGMSEWAVAQTVVLTDTNFSRCLKARYPSVMTPSGALDTQKASLLTSLICNRQNIVSVEGLQYFTGLAALTLNNNAIGFLPDLSKLTQLQTISLSSNQLQYLPDLSNQKRLKSLSADGNLLQVLTDLSHNDSLQSLDIHLNQLDTLPHLGHLKQLTYLNALSNRLRYLPGIEGLISLKTLIAWKNQLKELPSLANLPLLSQIDLSQNQLTKVPNFGTNRKIKTLYLDRNALSSLVDFSGYDSLQQARLYSNFLTFEDLIKLTSKAHYDTLFKITPQNTLQVGKRYELLENDPMVLSTGIDRGVSGVSYQWFKNGLFVSETAFDSLVIDKLQFQDSGKYTCQIKQVDFKGFSLQTDTFFVKVNPCLDTKEVTYETTGIRCMELGTLSVQGLKPLGVHATYHLKSTATNKTLTSTTGTFVGLTESNYELSFTRGNHCEKKYTSPVVLPFEPCKEAYLTPNNDGDTDTIFFPQTGKVTIYDKRGSVVKTLSIPADWDGTSKNGLVAQGYYTADINNGQELINISVMY